MNIEELRQKYSTEVVMGIDKGIADTLGINGILTRHAGPRIYTILDAIQQNLKPQLRCEAEVNLGFKQIIPYVLLRHSVTGDVYTTTRVGGDERLLGRLSIGLGGHMDGGESFISCMLRELQEEVGLADTEVDGLHLYGFINIDSCEVDSVHLGVVYIVDTHRSDIICMESDKLSGAWVNLHQLETFWQEGRMETWSVILLDSILGRTQNAPRKCDVCGKIAPVRVANSAYGPFSLAYCSDCLRGGMEPYGVVVPYVAGVGHFPQDLNEDSIRDIRRMLPLWGKTEEEFTADVEKTIKEMEELQL